MSTTTRIILILCCLFTLIGESNAAENATQKIYNVKTGDTLTKIARKFGLADFQGIVEANKIANPNKIYAKTVLRIPSVNVTNVQTKKPTHTAASKTTAIAERKVEKTVSSVQACSQAANPHEVGIASWYGHPYHGQRTASGEVYDMNAFTVAHPTLPHGTIVCVTSSEGKSVIAKVNDRGPFVAPRIIDVSHRIAQALDLVKHGSGMVQISILQKPKTKWRYYTAPVSMRKVPETTHVGKNVAKDSTASANVVNTQKQTSKPGNRVTLSGITQTLEEVIGPPYDVTPLAVLIHRQMEKSPTEIPSLLSPPHKQSPFTAQWLTKGNTNTVQIPAQNFFFSMFQTQDHKE